MPISHRPKVELTAGALHHVAVVVTNLPRAIAFYEHVLGLRAIKRWLTSDGKSERSVWFDLGNTSFLAVEHADNAQATQAPATKDAPGWHLVALTIRLEEREQWRAHLLAVGFPVTHETAYTLYCRDPEGNRIGLSHYPDAAAQ